MTFNGEKGWQMFYKNINMEIRGIKIILKKGAKAPTYATTGSAGCDVYALIDTEDGKITINPMERVMIHTGVYLDLPDDVEVQVRPRSGLAFKCGVTVLNAPGTIDSDYQGECNIMLINHSKYPFTVSNGDRIAQFVFTKNVIQAAFVEVDDFERETERGSGGFGHTGI